MPSSCLRHVSILPGSPPLSSFPPVVSKVPTSLLGHLLGFPKLQACARSDGGVAPGSGTRLPVAPLRSQRGAMITPAGEPPLTPGRRPSGQARVPEARCRRLPVPATMRERPRRRSRRGDHGTGWRELRSRNAGRGQGARAPSAPSPLSRVLLTPGRPGPANP